MLVPRRVRRRLLLPPGWVALGFLLLLGCQALRPWAGQLKQWSMVQLTMPRLTADTSYVHFEEEHAAHHTGELNLFATPLPEVAEKTLQQWRPWHTIAFTGNQLADFLSAATTESTVRKIIADTSHAGGVRIRFLPGATYANLVKVLDIMNYTNQKKYFLDIHHQPTTLYAITDRPLHIKQGPFFVCGMRYSEVHLPPKEVTFQEILTEFWEKLKPLISEPWQASALILAMISSLSLWQLFRPKFSRAD